ncbi:hypothetical protein L1049_022940 [Liquidambar formosana]|uniref:Uncharacterized protein n=1 Tax=Liquidambar formosana TaxID=63359 RepID=A0AAP0RDD8_LIQFO
MYAKRIRAVFDVAISVHKNIQQRDLEVGRNLGNKILRWLDHMKPSAQIRVSSSGKPPNAGNSSMAKQVINSSNQKTNGNIQKTSVRGVDREADGHLFTSPIHIGPKPFPTISMMMRPPKPAGTSTQYRHFSICKPEVLRSSFGSGGFGEGVIRKDIMEWMWRN